MNQLDELNRIQKKLQALKSERDQLTGRKDSIMESLKKEFDVDTIEKAEEKLLALKKKSSTLLEKFNTKMQNLKETYGW